MLSNVSLTIYLTFGLISILALYYFLKIILTPLSLGGKKRLAGVVGLAIGFWLIVHMSMAYNGFYMGSFDLPPRILAAIAPWVLLMTLGIVLTWKGQYLRQLSLRALTYINIFRLPLEFIVFSGLASAEYLPEIMTFRGNNFDILVGLTAPIIGYLYFTRKAISWKVLLAWNVFSLMLLINITFTAILSFPYAFQLFGTNQPNIAILHFPFILLPTLLVPIAYFCHITSIIKLIHYPECRNIIDKKEPNLDQA